MLTVKTSSPSAVRRGESFRPRLKQLPGSQIRGESFRPSTSGSHEMGGVI